MWQLILILITVCFATIYWYLNVLLGRIQTDIKLINCRRRARMPFNLDFSVDATYSACVYDRRYRRYQLFIECVCVPVPVCAARMFCLFNCEFYRTRDMRHEHMSSSKYFVYGTRNATNAIKILFTLSDACCTYRAILQYFFLSQLNNDDSAIWVKKSQSARSFCSIDAVEFI